MDAPAKWAPGFLVPSRPRKKKRSYIFKRFNTIL